MDVEDELEEIQIIQILQKEKFICQFERKTLKTLWYEAELSLLLIAQAY